MSIKTSYSPTAGTAYITFDNAKVPVENTLGPENAGLLVVCLQSHGGIGIHDLPFSLDAQQL